MSETPAIELRGIRARYEQVEVLQGIDLVVPVGSVFAVLGPNGAGKTTMLRVIAGLLAPSMGDVLIAGERANGIPAHVLARRGLCSIPEGRGIFPNLSVRDNLWMATHVGRSLGEVEEQAYRRFPRLGERRRQLAGTLSGGEQQMLALARAIATRPTLLLFDEPSMGLAPVLVQDLFAEVGRLASEGTTVLLVEQFASAVLAVADRAAVVVNGRVLHTGRPAEVEGSLHGAYLSGTAGDRATDHRSAVPRSKT